MADDAFSTRGAVSRPERAAASPGPAERDDLTGEREAARARGVAEAATAGSWGAAPAPAASSGCSSAGAGSVVARAGEAAGWITRLRRTAPLEPRPRTTAEV